MRKLRYLIRNFFGFDRSHTNAFLLLLPLVALFLFTQPLYQSWSSDWDRFFTAADKAKLDSLATVWKKDSTEQFSGILEESEKLLFYFNPNKASLEELKSLGFDDRLSKRIINYRERGGKFLVKKDLFKIYSMDSALYYRLYSFIELPDAIEKKNNNQSKPNISEQKAQREYSKIDLNTADTAQLKKVYGIGDKLSVRIIMYREKLGGFIDFSQLNEVYGLDSAVISRIIKRCFIEQDFKPNTININAADAKQLSAHPYVSKQTAEAIVAYRFQHGNFQSVEDISRIQIIEPKILQRILPYIRLNE